MPKKILYFYVSCLFVLIQSFGFSEQVAESEVKKNTQDIQFINYEGPNIQRDNPLAIKRIGINLARSSEGRPGKIVNYGNKYSLIHLYNNKTPELLGADILIFNPAAKIDHIKNVRRIISGFLEARYNYKAKDADTLAFFITIYNAVHRKELAYFSKNYQPAVLKYLNAENAGLDINYKNWAGKSRILIPLTSDSTKKSISSINTTEVTDKKVIKKIQEDPEKGIKERKDIVKIKEKEVTKKEQELTDKKKKLDEKVEKSDSELKKKETEITKKEKELEKTTDPVKKKELEKEIEKDKKELTEKKKDENALINKERKDFEDLQKKLNEKKQEIEKDKKEIKKDENELKIEKDPKNLKKELEKKSQTLDEKEAELNQREKDLKKNQTDKNIFQGKLFYLKTTKYLSGGHYNNEIYTINATSGKIEKKSPINSICGRKYDVFEEGIALIIHEGDHDSAHNLAILDRETLQVKYRSRENVFWRSFVENKNNSVYTLIIQDGHAYLARFDHQMKLQARSTEKIDQDSFISFFGDFIYINNEAKEIIVLKQDDLFMLKKIEP